MGMWQHGSLPTIALIFLAVDPLGIEPMLLVWEARVKTASPAGLLEEVNFPTAPPRSLGSNPVGLRKRPVQNYRGKAAWDRGVKWQYPARDRGMKWQYPARNRGIA